MQSLWHFAKPEIFAGRTDIKFTFDEFSVCNEAASGGGPSNQVGGGFQDVRVTQHDMLRYNDFANANLYSWN